MKFLKKLVFLNNLIIFGAFKAIKTIKLLKNSCFFNNLLAFEILKLIILNY